MRPLLINDLWTGIQGVLDAALDKWNEGMVPFFTSPYGIFVLFVALFVFLNSMRMRL